MSTYDFAIVTKMGDGKTIVTPYWNGYSDSGVTLKSEAGKRLIEREKIDFAIDYALSLDTSEFTIEIRYPK